MKKLLYFIWMFLFFQSSLYGQEIPRTSISSELINLGKMLSNEVEGDTIYILIPKEYSHSKEHILEIKDNRVIFFAYATYYFAHKDIIPCYYELKDVKSKNKKIVSRVYYNCRPINNDFSYEFICKLKINK